MRNLFILITLLLLSANTFAAETARITVVDMQKLLDSSTAVQGLKEQAKNERDHYQASIAKEEEALRKEEAKLTEQRNILTQDAFNEKRRQFNDKLTKVQHDFQEKRVAQEAKLKKSLDQVHMVISEIITALSKEEGFDLAIPTSQTLYATEKLDITKEVLEQLNKKLPKLTTVSSNDKEEDTKPKKDKKNNKKK